MKQVSLGVGLGGLLACLLGCADPGPRSGEASTPASGAPTSEVPKSEAPKSETPKSETTVQPDVESVLLVTVDTLRHDALGYAGSPARTPTIDRLATSGILFERAYAHSVVTLPSHANILTGLLPHQHGVRDNDGFVLSDTVPTAASRLAESGFATAAFVAAYPLDRRFGLARGFDLYDDRYPRAKGERPGDEVIAGALAWWRAHAGERRFLWVHLYEPHAPYEPPAAFATPDSDAYLGEVGAADAYLAPLLDPIVANAESALVVFTSDHGEALGDHGEPTHGLFAYEAVLRVPLVLWAPGLEPTRRSDVAAHVDLLPTLLASVGVDPPPGLPGRDLFAGRAPAPGAVYFESLSTTFERGWAPLRGVVDGLHKLIDLPLPELYDLAGDPGEIVNLIDDRPDLAARLRGELPDESPWPPRRDARASFDDEALAALGYLGGVAPPRASYGVEDDPKNLVHLHRKLYDALDHLDAGRLREAESLLREIIAARPDMGTAQHYLALDLLRQERLAEAIEVMQRSREAGLASPRLLRQLGLSLAEAGRFDDAVGVLDPLAEGGDPRALHDLGRVRLEAGDLEGASSALEQVLKLAPDDPEAYQTLSLLALRADDPQRALELATRSTELDAGLSLAWNYRGAAAHALGDRQQALEAWERAVELDPSNFDALFNIAVVADELGDAVRLRRALERFVATAPPERYAPHLESARALLESLDR